ncbi:sensory subunit of low CO2-induced protein complex [Halalkalibacter wakoensis JCM 9140]|uniref:Sensory subunit of low CO2-induced protein complex n=1 Tax=Halalkalibacter wakoensis JCM 9140 TaxID=1236970 RepID=W4Q0P2_9BACI|nr:fasciclin domain-containing protein [Halalkalibacter wakoensis]GAE25547.1 sensory subunit of low CO2-induced protein complex [Halalkalibacter wakoensis JCM 9140]
MVKKKLVLMSVVMMMILSLANGVLAAENSDNGKDILETAKEAGTFNTLVAALEKAELVDTLKGEGPFTVFAPTDDAFEKLLKDLDITAEDLLARDDLKDILLYHVVPEKVMSEDLQDGAHIKTATEQTVRISLNPVRVNSSNVVTPDIETSNGVIHVIDKVLLPN